jgi:Tol biopolymer transport system component
MFFNSDRQDVPGSFDLWMSYRQNTRDDFGWRTPVNLGPNINSSFFEAGASYFANRAQDGDDDDSDENGDDDEDGVALLFFNSTRPPGSPTNYDLYVSPQHSDGSFGLPTFLSELNSPCTDQRPSIRSDGLEIFFYSNRPVSGGAACATNNDLWVAKRDTLSQVWYTPENLGPVVNSEFNDLQPYISSDSRTLYFSSTRPGGPGLLDLYMTTRNRSKPKADKHDDD